MQEPSQVATNGRLAYRAPQTPVLKVAVVELTKQTESRMLAPQRLTALLRLAENKPAWYQ